VTESERDVVDLLSADHRDFEAVFRQLDDLRGKADPASVQRKRQLVDQVTIGLAKHSVAEETLVYPRVERQVDRAEARRSKQEHAEAEKTMKRLERMDAADPGFDSAVLALMTQIRSHVEHEEGRMFTELRAQLPREELVALAGRVEVAKKIAPTRPHPLTPNEAWVRAVAGPFASLLDHVRDAVSGRGRNAG